MSSSELPVARRVSMILAKILASSARALCTKHVSSQMKLKRQVHHTTDQYTRMTTLVPSLGESIR